MKNLEKGLLVGLVLLVVAFTYQIFAIHKSYTGFCQTDQESVFSVSTPIVDTSSSSSKQYSCSFWGYARTEAVKPDAGMFGISYFILPFFIIGIPTLIGWGIDLSSIPQ
jgi:hypothetical protein